MVTSRGERRDGGMESKVGLLWCLGERGERAGVDFLLLRLFFNMNVCLFSECDVVKGQVG